MKRDETLSDQSAAPPARPRGTDAATDSVAARRFVERFTERVPRRIAASFTDAQLRAVIRAFGLRKWENHTVDMRSTAPFFGRHYYFVLLADLEHRSRKRRRAERKAHPLVGFGNAVFLLLLLVVLASAVFAGFYILKSAFGVDIMPGVSLGIWDEILSQIGLRR